MTAVHTKVYLAVEGPTDLAVAERMLGFVGLEPHRAITAGGKSRLDPRIPALHRSGAHLNWLILRDLDHDASCPPELIRRLGGGKPSPRVSLRVPVRAVESWMIADADGFAREFSVDRKRLPERPDELDDPKRHLVGVCRRSRRPAIRQAMAPRAGSGRKVGPEYAARLSVFARAAWDPGRASRQSPSLDRTVSALRRLTEDGVWF